MKIDYGWDGDQSVDIKMLQNIMLQNLAAGTESIVQGGSYTVKNHGAGKMNVDLTASGNQSAKAKGDKEALMVIQGGKFDVANEGDGDLGFKIRGSSTAKVTGLLLLI